MTTDRTLDHGAPARRLVAAWDTGSLAEAHAAFLREEDPTLDEDEAFARACRDEDHFRFAWECLIDDLTELVQEIAPHGRFYAEGRNMGWRHLSGHKRFVAHDGARFLREILPDTECSFTIERDGTTLHIRNAHHDAPTGEFYTVRPDDGEGAP